jgi:radical SAM superfamily enzyme YgiQ (UPF0313 family)
MLGYPGETEETMQENGKLIKELRLFRYRCTAVLCRFPDSEVYENSPRTRHIYEDWEQVGSFNKIVYVPHGLSQEKITHYLNKML